MKRIPLQIWTKNVCIPFDNHRAPPIDGLYSHRSEIVLHSNPVKLKLSISKHPTRVIQFSCRRDFQIPISYSDREKTEN